MSASHKFCLLMGGRWCDGSDGADLLKRDKNVQLLI